MELEEKIDKVRAQREKAAKLVEDTKQRGHPTLGLRRAEGGGPLLGDRTCLIFSSVQQPVSKSSCTTFACT
jgi:hypothetical protein